MHRGLSDRTYYSGSRVYPYAAPVAFPAAHHPHHHPWPLQGFCHACCHPKVQCCCGCRECRKEAKELLVESTRDDGRTPATEEPAGISRIESSRAVIIQPSESGKGTAFIGGGCCVHLSVEYTPSVPTEASIVRVIVEDSENTTLGWIKTADPGSGYQIKEGIITTKPGAHLTVLVGNMTARVRWCEIFSC